MENALNNIVWQISGNVPFISFSFPTSKQHMTNRFSSHANLPSSILPSVSCLLHPQPYLTFHLTASPLCQGIPPGPFPLLSTKPLNHQTPTLPLSIPNPHQCLPPPPPPPSLSPTLLTSKISPRYSAHSVVSGQNPANRCSDSAQQMGGAAAVVVADC